MRYHAANLQTTAFTFAIAIVSLFAIPVIAAEHSNADQLAESYRAEIRPLIERYCHECHGASETIEADLNLAAIVSWADVSGQPQAWEKVGEMLGDGLMPPEDADQPTPAERATLEKWVHDYLASEAGSRAGDPGPVVLRRLSNAEYTYTLRDLTGVDSLDPAREFPIDGAAGEGFTNTGNALVMSPALVTKYLDAAKEVASHAVLVPDGFRFSPHSTSRDWTNDILTEIRAFYGQFSEAGGDHLVTQQGVPLDVGLGGRLPLEKYLAATLAEREALATGAKTIEAVARDRGLSAKYLDTLWSSLNSTEPSLLLDSLRAHWREAKPGDEAVLASEVAAWQKGLWSFASVGLIGRVGGPEQWLEPVSPLSTRQEIRLKIPDAPDGEDVVVSMIASDAGDGNEHDFVVWQQPRLVAPGRSDLLLRDVRQVANMLVSRRQQILPKIAAFLQAAEEVAARKPAIDFAEIAAKHGVDEASLRDWLDYLGIGAATSPQLDGMFGEKLSGVGGYDFINGWGTNDTPLLIANSSDQHVRVPGNMRPHGVCVHPSPTLRVAAGWRSPVTATMRIEADISLAHPECSNGVTWSLELRRGATRQQLAAGTAKQAQPGKVGPLEGVAVRVGDIVALFVGPRDGQHACDLTAIDLKLSSDGNGSDEQTWNLAEDVSPDVLAGNPHADRLGNDAVWHFYAEPDRGDGAGPFIPAGSLLAKWQIASSAEERNRLALEVQNLLSAAPPADSANPDRILYRQLLSFGGPLLSDARFQQLIEVANTAAAKGSQQSASEQSDSAEIGLDPAFFGKHPNGIAMDAASLCVHAPAVLEFRLPASLAAGCELVTTGVLDETTGAEGTAQLRVVTGKADGKTGLQLGEATIIQSGGQWSDDNRQITNTAPILVAEKSKARQRVEAQLDKFRQLFPAALCYTKIVPVDEVVTIILFHREDEHLQRLMLDDAQTAQLNRLWNELFYVSQDALKLVDVLEQVLEYASQDADPKVFEPLRGPFQERAAAFRLQLLDAEPKHVDALVDFAARAYRRPLTADESNGLRQLYDSLRRQEIPHEEAIRLTLARIFVAPAFLYRAERPNPGAEPGPVSDWELASRLSYFLWSSQPDDELRQLAEANRLRDPEVLVAQSRRMLRDVKVRRLATEFACHWLHIHDFDELDEKSDRHFPTFVGLRAAMYEESIQFFTHLFTDDASVLDILSSDYTFLNEDLAKHYGIPGVNGAEWRRVDGVKQFSRGGVLAQATTLAKQSGASRTSPILRGNWVSEVVLGERLPKPPKGVPPLPDDDTDTAGLTVRQLVEKHVSDPKCSVCHLRIDPYGFALENFDAIGRYRDKDLAGRPIDSHSQVSDGTPLNGFDGLRTYLLTNRRDAFLRQFCRKLLGYALGRSVQLSDESLLTEMQTNLSANDYHVASAVETIVRSPQFREIRGRDAKNEE